MTLIEKIKLVIIIYGIGYAACYGLTRYAYYLLKKDGKTEELDNMIGYKIINFDIIARIFAISSWVGAVFTLWHIAIRLIQKIKKRLKK